MKILIIQTAFIGDVILATPVIEKLKRFYPEAEIDFLLKKGYQALLANNPHLRQLLLFDKDQQKYRNLWKLMRKIRSEKYDLLINLHRFASSGFLAAFSGAKEKIGFDKNPFAFSYSRKFPHQINDPQHPVHEVERNLSLIQHLTDRELVRPHLYPSKDDFKKVEQAYPYVCMAPASKWFTKQWPAEKWIQLIDALADRYEVILLGGKEDQELCDHIIHASQAQRLLNLAGKLSFLASAALMQGAVMNIVNDSAPLHMASAMNAPVIGLFCSTIPEFGFGPLSEKSWVLETYHELNCRPCGLHGKKNCPLGHFRCAEIEIVEILDKFAG